MTWTNERIATLRKMWNDGKTANEIAKALGNDISRNAVIGKAHRLKLSKRPSPLPVKHIHLKHDLPFPCLAKKHHMTVKAEARRAARVDANEKVFGTGKTLLDLQPNECRWPVGEPPLFCSATIEKGVYCAEHNAIAYQGKNHDNEKTIVEINRRSNTNPRTR